MDIRKSLVDLARSEGVVAAIRAAERFQSSLECLTEISDHNERQAAMLLLARVNMAIEYIKKYES